MKFVCGYVHMEWSFDLFEAHGQYHYFLCKCGVMKRHLVATFDNKSKAIEWLDSNFHNDITDIENGLL